MGINYSRITPYRTNLSRVLQNFTNKLEEYNAFSIQEESQIASYYNIRQELEALALQFRTFLTKSQYLIPFMQPGRLIKIKTQDSEYDWGAVVNFKKIQEVQRKGGRAAKPITKIQLDILMHVLPSEEDQNEIPKPCTDDQKGEVEIVSVDSKFVTHISSVRLYCPQDLRSKDSRKGMYKAIKEVKKRFPEGPPLLNPVNDMKIKEEEFLEIVKKIEILEKQMFHHSMHNNQLLDTEYEKYEKKAACEKELIAAKEKLLKAKSVLQLDELKCRKRVLRRLGYCTNTDVIQLKGRVACELSSADELLITEMLFNGLFGKLTPQQACALLSCFVCGEKAKEAPTLSEELSGPLRQMQDLARRIAKVSNEARLPLDEDVYVEQFKPFLMDVVFNWCNGAKFSDLCKMTDIFEGSIVRCMRHLEELLRQMVQASKTIGNIELEDKFNTAIRLIKRDIVFSSSLYL